MKFRIKITTFQNGRKEFSAYKKQRIGWTGLDDSGHTGWAYKMRTRESALQNIDTYLSGYGKVKTIEFEYINQ